jgi:hypothetical protein
MRIGLPAAFLVEKKQAAYDKSLYRSESDNCVTEAMERNHKEYPLRLRKEKQAQLETRIKEKQPLNCKIKPKSAKNGFEKMSCSGYPGITWRHGFAICQNEYQNGNIGPRSRTG